MQIETKAIVELLNMQPPIHQQFFKEIAYGIVVFREVYYETDAFRSLQNSILSLNGNEKCTIYIYDNTDDVNWLVEMPDLPFLGVDIIYFHNYKNPGISTAYNHMAKFIFSKGIKWMVFMDQDTCLPLDGALHYVQAIHNNPNILLKAPAIKVRGKQFSPSGFRWMRAYLLKMEMQPGIYPLKKLTLINSCLMVNLAFFNSLNGYNERIKLDFTDTEFIERAKTKIEHFELLPFTCSHGFSNNSTSIHASLFRFKIYLRDLLNYPAKNAWQRLQLLIVGFAHTLQLIKRFHSLEFLKVWTSKVKH